LILGGGTLVMFYLALVQLPLVSGWDYILFSTAAKAALSYVPAIAFLVCCLAGILLDVWTFCGQNRAPWCRRPLVSRAKREAEEKGDVYAGNEPDRGRQERPARRAVRRRPCGGGAAGPFEERRGRRTAIGWRTSTSTTLEGQELHE
jgi:hypothetical protein